MNSGRGFLVVVVATIAGTSLVAGLAGYDAGLVVALAGLVVTWAACVRRWHVTRRPSVFRLVCASIGQLFGAFSLLVTAEFRDRNPAGADTWGIVLGALSGAAIFAFMSYLIAGYLRRVHSYGGPVPPSF
jgi:amino acid transporter